MTELAEVAAPDSAALETAPIADPKPMLEEFLAVMRESRGNKESTIRNYRAWILDFFRRTDVRDLRAVDGGTIEHFRGRLFIAGLSPKSRQVRDSALRTFFAWLVIRGHLPVDPTQGVPRIRAPITRRIPVLSLAEIARLTFRCPPATPPRRGRREPAEFFERRLELHNVVEVRDPALLALMYDCALRGGEPSLLEIYDYDERKGELAIRGAKWQQDSFVVGVLPSTAAAMSAYLDALRRSRWSDSAALFPPLGHRRADATRPASGIGYSEVYAIFKRRVERAGIEARGRRLSPHCLGRYSRATAWSDAGVPVEQISALLRHRSLQVTQGYIRLGPLRKMKRRADSAHLFRRVNFEIPTE